MTPRGDTNFALRAALLQLLGSGQPITTTELRAALDATVFGALTRETVYRHLDALARSGHIRRVCPPGRRYVYWARRHGGRIAASVPQARR